MHTMHFLLIVNSDDSYMYCRFTYARSFYHSLDKERIHWKTRLLKSTLPNYTRVTITLWKHGKRFVSDDISTEVLLILLNILSWYNGKTALIKKCLVNLNLWNITVFVLQNRRLCVSLDKTVTVVVVRMYKAAFLWN